MTDTHEPRCNYCGRDPYHYVDIGVGMEAVAIVCCEQMITEYYERLAEQEAQRNNRLLSQDNQPE